MNERIYICDGKKFTWKAGVTAHLIEKEDVCRECGSLGRRSTFHGGVGDDDDDGTCHACYGRGHKTWHGPMFLDNEVQPYLQKCLNEYIEDKIAFAKANPPFMGMGI